MAMHQSNRSCSPEPKANNTHSVEEINPVIEGVHGDVKGVASPPMLPTPINPEEKHVAKVIWNKLPKTEQLDDKRYPSLYDEHPADDQQHPPSSQLPIHHEPASQPCIHIHYHLCKFHQQSQNDNDDNDYDDGDNDDATQTDYTLALSQDTEDSDDILKDAPYQTNILPALALAAPAIASALAPVAKNMVTTGLNLITSSNGEDNTEDSTSKRRRRSRRKRSPVHPAQISVDTISEYPTQEVVTPTNGLSFPVSNPTTKISATPGIPYIPPNTALPLGAQFTPNTPVHHEKNHHLEGIIMQSNKHIASNVINELGNIGGISSLFNSGGSKEENKQKENEKSIFTLLSCILNSLKIVIRRYSCPRNGIDLYKNHNNNACKSSPQFAYNFQPFIHHPQNCYRQVLPHIQQDLGYSPCQSYQGHKNVFSDGRIPNSPAPNWIHPNQHLRNCVSHQFSPCRVHSCIDSPFDIQPNSGQCWGPPVQQPRHSLLPQFFSRRCLSLEKQPFECPLFDDQQLDYKNTYYRHTIQQAGNVVLPQGSQESHCSTNPQFSGVNINYLDEHNNTRIQDSRSYRLPQSFPDKYHPYCDPFDEYHVLDFQPPDYQGQFYCPSIQLPNDFLSPSFSFDEDFSCYLEAGIHQHFHSYIFHQSAPHND